jgi:hypothetical protein
LRFLHRQLHQLEDVEQNFGQLEGIWGRFQDFNGAPNATLWAATGAPSNSQGQNNDLYSRLNGSAGTFLYRKASGSWTAIL